MQLTLKDGEGVPRLKIVSRERSGEHILVCTDLGPESAAVWVGSMTPGEAWRACNASDPIPCDEGEGLQHILLHRDGTAFIN